MSGPYKQRRGKKRPRRVGDLKALQRMFWQALLEAEYILINANDADTTLRAIHAIATAGAGYGKLIEAVHVEERLRAVEARIAGHIPPPARRRIEAA